MIKYSNKDLVYNTKSEILLQNESYKRSNEILYLFYSAGELELPFLSKIGIQKCLYLTEILSPLKEIILSFLTFMYHHRGPYSKDISNITDHLVSMDAIEIVSFSTYYDKNSYANYKITKAGKNLVENLIYDPKEKEKLEWIRTIMRLIDAYKDAYGLGEEYKGVDKIIDLVYQEPSFDEIKQRKGKGEFIPVGYKDNLTMELIYFLKNIEQNLPKTFDPEKYKLDLETILLVFFEYLYVKYLSERMEIKNGV